MGEKGQEEATKDTVHLLPSVSAFQAEANPASHSSAWLVLTHPPDTP